MGAGDVCGRAGKFQDAHAGDRGRKRLPRAVHAITGIFQRVAAAGSAFKAGGLSGRRTLGAEAAERAVLVQNVYGLAGDVPEINGSSGGEQALKCAAREAKKVIEQED